MPCSGKGRRKRTHTTGTSPAAHFTRRAGRGNGLDRKASTALRPRPNTVDGLVLAALRRGRAGRWWIALGIAVSAAGPIVSAWPPLALFGTHRLLHAHKRSGR
jgi:hypothetical protein